MVHRIRELYRDLFGERRDAIVIGAGGPGWSGLWAHL